jgi:hypothetical protein
MKMFTSPAHIVDAIGVRAFAEHLGVDAETVRKGRYAATLPASWYAAAEAIVGEPLPRHLFAFRQVRERGAGLPAPQPPTP